MNYAHPSYSWAWSGEALTYYPDGDQVGPDDGYPGSLYGTGHNWNQYVAEISIPVPVNSVAKELSELNTAKFLQEFQNIRSDLYSHLTWEIPRADLVYLPKQGEQGTDKLHFCWSEHVLNDEFAVTHRWSELTLSEPRPAGAWALSGYSNYSTCDYMFDIPQSWAAANTPGQRLATGRYRDGSWGGQGPSLFAYGPWNAGNPPPRSTELDATVLLGYDDVRGGGTNTMQNQQHSDEWSGGAWLTTGGNAAVIFVGTKGEGRTWYGYADGTAWPDEPPYPPIPDPPSDERGWWSDKFVGQILFYDPDDLAAVANGTMVSYEPQPYATKSIDDRLYNVQTDQQWHHVGAATYDPARRLLYVLEPLVDEDKPIVHVWSID